LWHLYFWYWDNWETSLLTILAIAKHIGLIKNIAFMQFTPKQRHVRTKSIETVGLYFVY
jgi:hypothetical protein